MDIDCLIEESPGKSWFKLNFKRFDFDETFILAKNLEDHVQDVRSYNSKNGSIVLSNEQLEPIGRLEIRLQQRERVNVLYMTFQVLHNVFNEDDNLNLVEENISTNLTIFRPGWVLVSHEERTIEKYRFLKLIIWNCRLI